MSRDCLEGSHEQLIWLHRTARWFVGKSWTIFGNFQAKEIGRQRSDVLQKNLKRYHFSTQNGLPVEYDSSVLWNKECYSRALSALGQSGCLRPDIVVVPSRVSGQRGTRTEVAIHGRLSNSSTGSGKKKRRMKGLGATQPTGEEMEPSCICMLIKREYL